MSDSFFKQINQLTTTWEPPPRPSEEGWLVGFDSATELQKKNIANSWMWSLNNEFITSDDACKTIFLMSHYQTYAKLSPYVDASKFRHHPYDGSYETVTQRVAPGRWNHMSEEIRDKFLAACEKTWFTPNADKKQAYSELIETIHMADIHGQRQMARFYPVLLKEVWRVVSEQGVMADDEWQRIATYLTVRSALDVTDTGPCLQALNNLHHGRAWFVLASHAKYNNSLDITSIAGLQSVVKETNPRAASRAFKSILERAYTRNSNHEHCLRPNTTLNHGPELTTDIYGMLRTWIPGLTDYWTTAEGLGIPYYDALGYAAEGTTVGKPLNSLPEGLNLENVEANQL